MLQLNEMRARDNYGAIYIIYSYNTKRGQRRTQNGGNGGPGATEDTNTNKGKSNSIYSKIHGGLYSNSTWSVHSVSHY